MGHVRMRVCEGGWEGMGRGGWEGMGKSGRGGRSEKGGRKGVGECAWSLR